MFEFENNHDNGTVTGILSQLNDIEAGTVLIICLYLLYLSEFQKKICFTRTSIGKCHKGLEINFLNFVDSILSKKDNGFNPRVFILNIEGATNHYTCNRLKSRSE